MLNRIKNQYVRSLDIFGNKNHISCMRKVDIKTNKRLHDKRNSFRRVVFYLFKCCNNSEISRQNMVKEKLKCQ